MATVLIIDDEPMLLGLFREMVLRAGFAVVTAANARDGIRALEEAAFDVAVVDLDVRLEQGGGFIRELVRRWPALRIIAMSGYQDEARNKDHDPALAQGARATLEKPFTHDALIAAIESVANG